MTRECTPLADCPPDPRPTFKDHVVDNLTARSGAAWCEQHAAAVELEAQMLAAAQPHLDGVASLVTPTRCPEHYREALKGKGRHLWLIEFAALITDHRREPRAAGLAMLEAAARAGGYTLQALAPAETSLVDAAISAGAAGQEALAETTRALADGVVDEREEGLLRDRADRLHRVADELVAAVRSAKAKRR